MKNSSYLQALLDEERQAKAEKARGHSAFVDDEAEEEKEEGQQRGLGDFGFGTTAGYKDKKEEEDALRITKADIEGIVDDVSDDEGDEEAGMKARLEMDERADKARDKSIIKAITEGHDSKHKKKNDLEYERLLGGEEGKKELADMGDAPEEEDLEEMLQRGMKDRFEREREADRRNAMRDSDDDDEAGEEDEEELDMDGMTEEERRTEEEHRKRRRQQNEKERLRRREFEHSTRMRRHLRRQQGTGAARKVPPGLSLSLEGLDMDADEEENTGANFTLHRQSSKSNGSPRPAASELSPRTVLAYGNTSTFGASNTGGGSAPIKRRTQVQPVKTNLLVRKKSVGEGSSKSNSMYKASLGQAEAQEGMGLGMVAARSTSLLSAVTGAGAKRPSSFAAAAGVAGGLLDGAASQRLFSKSSKRRKNNSGGSSVTVAAQQFVFMNGDESQAATNGNSTWGDSRAASNTGTFPGGSKSQGGMNSQGGSASLFKAVFSRSNALQSKPNANIVHAR